MVRRAFIVCSFLVVVFAPAAVAGQSSLSTQLLTAANITFSGSVPLDVLHYDDPVDDIYHPAGEAGLLDGRIDLTSVEMTAWAIDIAAILDGPNPFAALANGDGIKRDGPAGFEFSSGIPYVVAEFEVATEFRYADTLFCEYPLAWSTPGYPTFEGIPGDLFNGTNYVTVARIGAGVPDGFQVRSLEFMDGSWQEMDPFGFAAASGNRLVYAIPAEHFGSAGDGMRRAFGRFLRGGQSTATVVDFNFGAFCSEGGRSFDPSLGGADILQESVDLAGLPVTVLGAPETTTSTTEAPPATATTTTLDDTPVTSVAPGEEEPAGGDGESGGINPALIALILGGAGAAAFGIVRAMRDGDDQRRPPGFAVRLDIDGGPTGSFTDVSGLELETDKIDYRSGSEGQSPSRQPGIPKFTNIILKGGSISDGGWLEAFRADTGFESGRLGVRSDDAPEITWKFDRGWPGKWTGPGFNAANNEVAMETLELRLENLRMEPGQ
jgi:phage tail-like protein